MLKNKLKKASNWDKTANIILKGKSVGDYLKQLKQDAIDIGSDEVLEEIKLLESVQPLFENLLQLDNESFLLTLNKKNYIVKFKLKKIHLKIFLRIICKIMNKL